MINERNEYELWCPHERSKGLPLDRFLRQEMLTWAIEYLQATEVLLQEPSNLSEPVEVES